MTSWSIVNPGTDQEMLERENGHRFWLDISSDPQTSIGWVEEDADRSTEIRTVSEVLAALPDDARAYVLEHTERQLKRAVVRARERAQSQESTAALMVELEEARSGQPGSSS